MDRQDYLEHLESRLSELITLPLSQDKVVPVQNLISRYTSELRSKIKNEKNIETIKIEFKHYVKNILSIVETLISGEQFKALRRLLQNEIYSCCDVIVSKKDGKQ